jgi:uncharacterized protein YlxW (UPF0749 family)
MMKSENVLTFLSEVFRREAKLPQEVKSLAESMTTLATEITKISNSIIKLTKLINDHGHAIEQIVSVQEYILGTMKDDMLDSLTPAINKEKLDKPN